MNKKFLFAAGDNNEDIYTFSIQSDGALKQVSEINAQKYNPDHCGSIGPLQMDDTGSTLYNQVNDSCQGGGFVQAFKTESKGELQYLGSTSALPTDVVTIFPPLRFIGSNKVAWEAGCGDDDGLVNAVNVAYKRESNGLLTYLSNYNDAPDPKNPDDIYCPTSLTTDSTDHVAFALLEYNNDEGEFEGNSVLAIYTADAHGNLTTKSTWENMPTTDLSPVSTMSISPSGKLLAVGGSTGFQIFHLNGADPITPYTALLQSSANVLEFGWDNHHHLFVVSTGGLFVYTVTPTSMNQVAGSPYSIPEASSVIVLDK